MVYHIYGGAKCKAVKNASGSQVHSKNYTKQMLMRYESNTAQRNHCVEDI